MIELFHCLKFEFTQSEKWLLTLTNIERSLLSFLAKKLCAIFVKIKRKQTISYTNTTRLEGQIQEKQNKGSCALTLQTLKFR